METREQRRLNSVSGHLLQQTRADNLIVPGLQRGEEAKTEGAVGDPVVIGGMILDIHATPSDSIYPRSTVPGHVHYVMGGVARNIAECMAKLGTRPYMISAVGLDMAGNMLLHHWNSAGLSISGIRQNQDIKTAVICIVFDSNGEVAAGVASVEAVEKFLTPEWIWQSEEGISHAPVVMVDANLSLSALQASCQVAAKHHIPVWFEPVSVVKSKRIASIAKFVTFASPNEDELIAMANVLCGQDMFKPFKKDKGKVYSIDVLFELLKPAILVLLEKGIKIVVVTLGADGVFLCSRGLNSVKLTLKKSKNLQLNRELHNAVTSNCSSSRFSSVANIDRRSNIFAVHFPAIYASVVRLTGAGDCLVGGTLSSLCSGLDVMQSVAVGVAVAKAAVEAETNVPWEFNYSTIAEVRFWRRNRVKMCCSLIIFCLV